MNLKDREERRTLKQKLFTIRRYVEGENVKLTKEMRELKAKYESTEGFSSWSDFPHVWDIGDPNFVKKGSPAFSSAEYQNFQRIAGQPYDAIVRLEIPPKTRQEIEAMALLKKAELGIKLAKDKADADHSKKRLDANKEQS